MIVRNKLLLPLTALTLAFAFAAPALADDMGKVTGSGMSQGNDQGGMSQPSGSKMSGPSSTGGTSQPSGSGMGGSSMGNGSGGSGGMSK